MVEAAGIEPASAWRHTARVYVRSPVFVLASGLASVLAEPVASRVLSRPPPPDEDLDQPAFYYTPAPQQASGAGVLVVLGIN